MGNHPHPYHHSPAPHGHHVAPTNSMAIVSLVMGISGFIICITAPVAIVCGHIARYQIRNRPPQSGDGLAVAGLITGYILTLPVIILSVLMGLGFFSTFISDKFPNSSDKPALPAERNLTPEEASQLFIEREGTDPRLMEQKK